MLPTLNCIAPIGAGALMLTSSSARTGSATRRPEATTEIQTGGRPTRLRTRIWQITAATCFVPALFMSDARLTASAREIGIGMGRPTLGAPMYANRGGAGLRTGVIGMGRPMQAAPMFGDRGGPGLRTGAGIGMGRPVPVAPLRVDRAGPGLRTGAGIGMGRPVVAPLRVDRAGAGVRAGAGTGMARPMNAAPIQADRGGAGVRTDAGTGRPMQAAPTNADRGGGAIRTGAGSDMARPLHAAPMHADRGGAGLRTYVGTGIGMGVGRMLIDEMQRQQANAPQAVPANTAKPSEQIAGTTTGSATTTTKDETLLANKVDEPAPRGDPKDNPVANGNKKDEPASSGKNTDQPVSAGTTPAEPPLALEPPKQPAPPPVPVATPAPPSQIATPVPAFRLVLQPKDCNDCDALWEEMVRYQKIIADDMKKLADAEKELEERMRERDLFEDRLNSERGPIQKAYYQARIRNADEHIEGLTQQNASLRKLIQEERELLARLVEQYQRCADAHCAKQVSEAPVPRPARPRARYPYEPGPVVYPAPRIQVSAPPQPTPASAPNSCPDHHAELTNGKRVFHRLYVQGPALPDVPVPTKVEPILDANMKYQMHRVRRSLEGAGRQASGSTSRTLDQPTYAAFEAEMKKLQALAQPCDEVTIVVLAHGSAWPGQYVKDGEVRRTIFGSVSLTKDANGRLDSRQLGSLVKGFRKDVSVTVVMLSCYGGGFAGEFNVEESQLVQVIGNSDTCPAADVPFRDELPEEIENGVDKAAEANSDGRVTASEIKSHLAMNGWPIGRPYFANR